MILIQGVPTIFSNVDELHSIALIQRTAKFNDMILEKNMEAQAESMAERGMWGQVDTGDDGSSPTP